jgi:hypothetical protein
MDIDQHVSKIVESVVGDITTQIKSQVVTIIEERVNDIVNSFDYTPLISNILGEKLSERISQLPIDTNTIEQVLTNKVTNLAAGLSADVREQTSDMVRSSVNASLSLINVNELYQSAIISAIANQRVIFPNNSIPIAAMQVEDITLSGDAVSGGIIKNFGSTGIQDLSSDCQLTITDDLTVVENNLLTKDLTVKGSATIEGDLIVTGSIPDNSPMFIKFVNAAATTVKTSLDQTLFETYAKTVTDQIYANGLNLNQIKLNGHDIVNGNALGNFIIESNLQTVGVLKELQTLGETFLSQTLYSSQKRVGINTIDPTSALSLWDQEVEIGFGKLESNTAFISTPRSQKLILGSNGKKNLVLTPEGGTEVNSIKINNMMFTTGSTPPSTNATKGTVVFNENPTLGGPLGWISLGDARWANFGIID